MSVAEFRVERGADVNAKTTRLTSFYQPSVEEGPKTYPEGSTPLDVARIRGSNQIAEFLRSQTE